MKRGEWDRKTFVGTELQGKTLGVIGFGRIGQRVAARARGFEMKILAADPVLDPALARRLDVELVPLDELLAARRLRHAAHAAHQGDPQHDRRRATSRA